MYLEQNPLTSYSVCHFLVHVTECVTENVTENVIERNILKVTSFK